jgi:hypothetical protein
MADSTRAREAFLTHQFLGLLRLLRLLRSVYKALSAETTFVKDSFASPKSKVVFAS